MLDQSDWPSPLQDCSRVCPCGHKGKTKTKKRQIRKSDIPRSQGTQSEANLIGQACPHTPIFREAQRRRKSLCVCWLDLANAFGSVHHDLIVFSLAHYHAPPEKTQLVSNQYDGLTAVISTEKWTTAVIHLQLGVYQGDPLSFIIFNAMMNTLVDSITQYCAHLGYSLNSVSSRINLLQYADDTSLIGDGPSSCPHLLSLT